MGVGVGVGVTVGVGVGVALGSSGNSPGVTPPVGGSMLGSGVGVGVGVGPGSGGGGSPGTHRIGLCSAHTSAWRIGSPQARSIGGSMVVRYGFVAVSITPEKLAVARNIPGCLAA